MPCWLVRHSRATGRRSIQRRQLRRIRDARQPVASRVADLIGRMTLEEKVGQMTQAERGAVAADPSLSPR